MKPFLLGVLLLFALPQGRAQTDSPSLPANAVSNGTNAASQTSDITSEHVSFSLVQQRSTYMLNVRFNNPRMKLTCEWLLAEEPPGEKSASRHIVATTNVVMDLAGGTNGTWHVTCDRAVYDSKVVDATTNEIVTLTGNARAESEKYIVTGEPLVYDMQLRSFTSDGYRMVFKQPPHLSGNTNSPESKTNASTVPPLF